MNHMEISDLAKLSKLDLLLAEIQHDVKVTRIKPNKAEKRFRTLTLTKVTRTNSAQKVG